MRQAMNDDEAMTYIRRELLEEACVPGLFALLCDEAAKDLEADFWREVRTSVDLPDGRVLSVRFELFPSREAMLRKSP